jgi:hypothetical protein
LTVTPAHGAAVSWAADGSLGQIEISRRQMPVLDVVAAIPEGEQVSIEAAQESGGQAQSLGRQVVRAGDLVHWAYCPGGGHLSLRTSQGGYTTAWYEVQPNGALVAPRIGRQQIALQGAAVTMEVEVRSAAGEGPAVRHTVSAGQAHTIDIPQDLGANAIMFRRRLAEDEAWSEWRPASGHVLRLDASIT